MSINLFQLIVVGVLAAGGAYLLMERSLVRMLLGLLLVGNAINLLILVVSGPMGSPPIKGQESQIRDDNADPLAQAMVLTAIVITMGVAAFVLSMVYRLFVINRDDDEVADDTEDVKILSGTLDTAPDRDRTDDPVTLADTAAGDLYDDEGNPITAEEAAARHAELLETDIMPEDDDVLDELGDDSDDDPDENNDDGPDSKTESGDEPAGGDPR